MVLDSGTWRHCKVNFNEKFCILIGNPTLCTQPKLIRFSNENLLIVLIYSFPILYCNVDVLMFTGENMVMSIQLHFETSQV